MLLSSPGCPKGRRGKSPDQEYPTEATETEVEGKRQFGASSGLGRPFSRPPASSTVFENSAACVYVETPRGLRSARGHKTRRPQHHRGRHFQLQARSAACRPVWFTRLD